MLRFVIRRLLVTIPMVLVVITLTWGLIRLAPGNFYAANARFPPPSNRTSGRSTGSISRGTCSTDG